MQKGSGSGKGGTGVSEPQTAAAAGPAGPGRQPAILSEPTQRLDAARIQQAAAPAADESILDVDEAWEDLASEDSDGEVEALSDDEVDLDEGSAVHDLGDALEAEEDAEAQDEGRVDDGLADDVGDEPSQSRPAVPYELSSRLDVSDEVLEELSLPKHLAAAAAGLRPLGDPLFDNMPTQQAPEELRAALLKRGLVAAATDASASAGASAKLPGDPIAKAPSTVRSDEPAKRAVSPSSSKTASKSTADLVQLQAQPAAATSLGRTVGAVLSPGPASKPAPVDPASVAAPQGRAEELPKPAAAKTRAEEPASAAAAKAKAAEPAKAAAEKARATEPAKAAAEKARAAEPAKAAAEKARATEPAKAAAANPLSEAPAKAATSKAPAEEPAKLTASKARPMDTGESVSGKASAEPGKVSSGVKAAALETAVAAVPPSASQPSAAPKAVAAESGKATLAESLQRSDGEKIKPIGARLGTADVTLIDIGPATPVSAAGKKAAAENKPVVATAVGPATPTLIAVAPVPQVVKLPAASQAAASASKGLAPMAVAVPAALLKKDAPTSKPAAERPASEQRSSSAALSGATFVLPSSKESQPAPASARVIVRERAAPIPAAEARVRGGGRGGGGGDATAGSGDQGEPPRDEIRRAIEQRVQKRAREFSLPALLDVLQMLDYRPDEIEFLGVMSYSFPGSLIHSVDFVSSPRRMAKISLHMGLLSAQSPLPSYFLKYAEQLEIDALFDFLGFFDHHLLKGRAASLYPERDRTVFADWSETQAQLLQLIGLTAPSTLHWLFQRVYPELGIEVRRSTERKPLNAEGVVLGNAKLGEACAFGGGTTVPVGGLEVTLYSEEELTPTGTSWAVEASLRLNRQVFSALGETDVYLTVYLVIMEQTSWLMMEDERYLGFEPLWEDLRGDLAVPSPSNVAGPGSKGSSGRGRQAEILARSRSAYRIHQMQLFSGPIKHGRHGKNGQDGSSTQLLAGMSGG